jgi:type I restriction enzyme R subunit
LDFLKFERPKAHEAAARAESSAHSDREGLVSTPGARWNLELAVHWLFKHDPALKLPYPNNLSAVIHKPAFKTAVGPVGFAKRRVADSA